MRRYWLLASLVLAAVALVACGGADTPVPEVIRETVEVVVTQEVEVEKEVVVTTEVEVVKEVEVEKEVVKTVEVLGLPAVNPLEVTGDIVARSVTVGGRVLGNVKAGETFELQASGRIEGDVKAPRVIIAEGAFFKGNVEMTGGQ